MAISLAAFSEDAVAGDGASHLAQHANDASTRPVSAAGAPASAPANSPDQIRKAQTELRRLDCLKGRINGKLNDPTREAVRKFWTMARQPVVDVNITDELISNLAERGDNFCRPPRRFFGFGGRSLPPMFAPGARPGFVPPAAVAPASSDAAH
jgi:hypothetical protein